MKTALLGCMVTIACLLGCATPTEGDDEGAAGAAVTTTQDGAKDASARRPASALEGANLTLYKIMFVQPKSDTLFGVVKTTFTNTAGQKATGSCDLVLWDRASHTRRIDSEIGKDYVVSSVAPHGGKTVAVQLAKRGDGSPGFWLRCSAYSGWSDVELTYGDLVTMLVDSEMFAFAEPTSAR